MERIIWSYGVTTCQQRYTERDVYPRTITSLKDSGFNHPLIFVDGMTGHGVPYVIGRTQSLGVYGNWIMSAWNLYLNNPNADRYAIFQDDILTVNNLKDYLDQCPFPARGYLNLFTVEENTKPIRGWYLSNRLGRGALALVFNNEGLRTLLASPHLINAGQHSIRGKKGIDGTISEAMSADGWKEYVHNPSLVLHIGERSTIGHHSLPNAVTWRSDYDPLASARAKEKSEVPIGNSLTPKNATGGIPGASVDRPTQDPTQAEAAQKTANVASSGPSPARAIGQRIGLVGYSVRSGLGEVNRCLTKYCDIDSFLVKPHPKLPTVPNNHTDVVICREENKVKDWLKSIDILLFAESPLYENLIRLAKEMNKRIVCIPMLEWMPENIRGWPQEVDLFICPTDQCFKELVKDKLPCIPFSWPIDTNRFKFRQVDVVKRFLFINGHGGWKGRKGSEIIQQAKRMWPDMPLLVATQTPDSWPIGTQFVGAPLENYDLYNKGDVLIAPHRVDGIGLELLESISCGMPVIATNGKPWTQWPLLDKIQCEIELSKVNRIIEWHIPDVNHLVKICQSWLGKSVSDQSLSGRRWAESRSWDLLAQSMSEAIRYGAGS